MLRFLAYILLFFLVFRLVGSLFRMIMGSSSKQGQYPPHQNRDNINVRKNQPAKKKKEGYKGGEYVDFEEVE